MKADPAFNDSATDDITPAVLAIGRPSFPQALISTLQSTANVGHCMVFTFEGERSVRCLLDIGNIPIGADLGIAYSEHFHLSDPNRDVIFRGRSTSSPVMLPAFARRMYSARYRRIFFDDSEIVDKCAAAIWVEHTCFYVNFYRIAAQGCFSCEEIDRLSRIAPAVSATIARHLQEDVRGERDPFRKLEILFATTEPLSSLTGREREVCFRIISGFSSEGISIDLGISLHSTLTYRKRAYDKLGISSQNELFGIALRLIA